MTKLEQMNVIANEINKSNQMIGARLKYYIDNCYIIAIQYYLIGIEDLLYTVECDDKNLLENLKKLKDLI